MRWYAYRALLPFHIEIRAVRAQVVGVSGLFLGRQVRPYRQIGICREGPPRVANFFSYLCVDIRVFATAVLMILVQLRIHFSRVNGHAVRQDRRGSLFVEGRLFRPHCPCVSASFVNVAIRCENSFLTNLRFLRFTANHRRLFFHFHGPFTGECANVGVVHARRSGSYVRFLSVFFRRLLHLPKRVIPLSPTCSVCVEDGPRPFL